jgi:hypothetical protein
VGHEPLSLGCLQLISDPSGQFDCSSSHLGLWRHLKSGQVTAGLVTAGPVLKNGSLQGVGHVRPGVIVVVGAISLCNQAPRRKVPTE